MEKDFVLIQDLWFDDKRVYFLLSDNRTIGIPRVWFSRLKTATKKAPTKKEVEDLLFATKLVKHSKSNTIVLAKNKQLCASGVGQTSRIDALKQAILKSNNFKFDLNGAVMASDAFFPFADSVQIAFEAGITSVIQPGGSVRDQESIDYCDKEGIAMVFTGTRHFKH